MAFEQVEPEIGDRARILGTMLIFWDDRDVYT